MHMHKPPKPTNTTPYAPAAAQDPNQGSSRTPARQRRSRIFAFGRKKHLALPVAQTLACMFDVRQKLWQEKDVAPSASSRPVELARRVCGKIVVLASGSNNDPCVNQAIINLA